MVADEKGPSSHSHRLHGNRADSVTFHANPILTAALRVIEHPQPPWSEWAENDLVLRQKTGLHRENVDWLYEQSKEELLQLRLTMRHRNENAPPCSPHNMLVITLHWLRKYPSFRDLAVDTKHTSYYLWQLVHRVVSVIHSTSYTKLVFPADHTSPVSTRAGLLNVKILVDSTFMPLPQDSLPIEALPQEESDQVSVEDRDRM